MFLKLNILWKILPQKFVR